MIEFLRGILLERSDGHVVVDVGGVGYGLSVPVGTSARLGEAGAEVALWVRTYVREDTLRLYGFATRHEREVFDVFLTLSGIGPAVGLAVLSQMSIGEIVGATVAGDAARFRKVKGIGPKLADKLILELKGRAERLAAGMSPQEMRESAALESPLPTDAARDAVAALEALDVRPAAARLALEALGPDASTETLVREGLKHRRGA
jgi:Holliday junction DNA helicase RuvA